MAVIDASVYIAAVNAHEESHERSLRWLQQAAAEELQVWAPSIMLAEVAAALARGLQDPAQAMRAVALLRNSKVIRLQQVSVALAERAARLAAEQKIRGCDAVYVALAAQLDQPLVTLDRQQCACGGKVVQVIEL